MDSMEEMQIWKERIDGELNAFFDEKIKSAEAISLSASDVLEEIKTIVMRGGKRIRPILIIMGYKGFGGKNEKDILKACIAIEILHHAFLLQDDVMDQSDKRHGGPALHKVFNGKGRFSENMAHCGVDYLIGLSYHAIEQSNFPSHLKLKAIDRLSKIIYNTASGQILDLEQQESNLDELSEDDIIEMHMLKTAKYSFEGPLYLGAILAGASEDVIFKLSEYAIPLGQAFQIRDDILGMFGTKEKLGKPVDSDLKEGKRTLLMLKAYRTTNNEGKKFILKILGNKSATEEELLRVRKILIDTGSCEYSHELATKLVDRARCKLKKCDLSPDVKLFLDGIAEFMIKREH